MNIFEQMQKTPFNLDEGQIGWVKETFSKMDLKAKIGQLFCLAARSSEEQWVNDIFDISVCRNSRNYSRPLRPTATSPKGRGLGNIRADAGLTGICENFRLCQRLPLWGSWQPLGCLRGLTSDFFDSLKRSDQALRLVDKVYKNQT